MLKMRLQRIGRKNNPTYRVLVVDSRQGPKSGKFIDQIGSYDPKEGKPQIDTEKAKSWIEKGVQVSGTVHNMLVDLKVIDGKKVNVLPKKTPIIKEEATTAEGDSPETSSDEVSEAAETEGEEEKKEDAPAEDTETAKKEETPAAA